MTRKDYQNAAALIREQYGTPRDEDLQQEWRAVIDMFARFFQRDNSAFRRDRFEEACKEK